MMRELGFTRDEGDGLMPTLPPTNIPPTGTARIRDHAEGLGRWYVSELGGTAEKMVELEEG